MLGLPGIQLLEEGDMAESESAQITRGVGIISLFTLASRVLGAVRDLVIAHIFGAGAMTDAFVQAFTIPNVLRRLTAEGSMNLAFIPLYTEIRRENGKATAAQFARRGLGLVLWVTIGFTLIGITLAPLTVLAISSGFADDPVKFKLTTELTRIMFPYLIFVSIVAWAMSVLNAEKRFAAPAAAPILLNISIISAALFFTGSFEEPVMALGWGVVIGGFVQVLLQLPSLRSVKQSVVPRTPWGDKKIKELLLLLGPALFGVAVYQLNLILLRNIASFLPTGQVTYYYNASRLTELVLGVFAFAIATASFPALSEHTTGANWEKAERTLQNTFATTMLVVLPASAGLMGAAEPIVSMIYLHGAYTWSDTLMTIKTLQAFALSIPATAAVRILVPVFYALKDTKTPVGVSAVSMVVTISTGWTLSLYYDVVGLALGLSIGTWFQWFALLFLLKGRGSLSLAWLSWSRTRIYLIYALVCGLSAWIVGGFGLWEKGYTELNNWLWFLASIASGAGLYGIALMIHRDPYLFKVLHMIRQKLRSSEG
jgi:putative peptidoglycan lipid II flippase